jgi:asparagine synthetase A
MHNLSRSKETLQRVVRMNIEKMKLEKEFGYLKINGKYFDGIDNHGELKFVEVKDIDKKIKKAKEMAKILEESLDREAVLMEAVMKLHKDDFEKLYKSLKSNRKYKAITRAHRCVDMKIGNFILPIVND